MPTEAERSPYFYADEEKAAAFDETWGPARGPLAWFKEVNNIPIAHRYMSVGFLLFLLAGFMALLFRIQLAEPESDFMNAAVYNQLFTMHGSTMMFLFVIPFTEAVATYLLPLLLGTRELPFPRMTALAFWTYVWGALYIFSSFLFGLAPDAGWFAYVPLSNRTFSPGLNVDFWDIGLSVAEVAAMGAAAEFSIAALRMRAPGMALHRMPIAAWALLIMSFMILFAFTPLIVGTIMLELDRKALTSFFVPEVGGKPLLWQHIFWIFGHPEVYIFFIPAIGFVSQIVQVFARRPLIGYTLVVLAMIVTAFVSFGLWVHHMFTTGLSPTAMGFFAAASLTIAIPSGVQVFTWIATIWTGRPVWKTPLYFIMGFIILFVAGGLTGVMVGSVPFDQQVHDSYFVVAHFHYVIIGGVIFPIYAALYHWLPKITGRMLSERLGKIQFWLMFVFFNVAFFPMHIVGMLGMPRRVYTYQAGLGWEPYNVISTIGAWGFGLSAALIVVNLIWSLKRGRPAGANPWGADSLEWWEPSPVPSAQLKFLPFIRSRNPLWAQSSLEPATERERRLVEPLRSGPIGWRGALVVSVLDGRPIGIVQVPGPTIWPFVMSVGFLLLFLAALIHNSVLAAAGLVVTAVSVWGWFKPQPESAKAIEEIGTHAGEDRLPLAVAGPASNGWWAMIIFCLVLATALATLIGSYFYLLGAPRDWPPPVPGLGLPIAVTVGHALLAAVVWYFARGTRRDALNARRFGLIAAGILGVIVLGLTVLAWTVTGLVPRESAAASGFVSLLGFQWFVLGVLVIAIGMALLWAWRAPKDPRGHGVALNAELLGYFSALSWIAVFVILYLIPRVQ